MNVAQATAAQQQFACSPLKSWLAPPPSAAATSTPAAKNSDHNDEHNAAPSTQGQTSSDEGEEQFSPVTSTSPKSETPPEPAPEIKPEETAPKSYSMEDLLRNDPTPNSEVVRRQKRKQVTPVQMMVGETDAEATSSEANPLKRPREDFLSELSRSTTDYLTRELRKSGLECDLKGMVRKALETSLENMNAGRSPSLPQNSEAEPVHRGIDHPDGATVSPPESLNNTLRFPPYVPPPTAIMDAIGNNIPAGFGQSFSTYYEAACRALQAQHGWFPPPLARPPKPAEVNISPKNDPPKVRLTLSLALIHTLNSKLR